MTDLIERLEAGETGVEIDFDIGQLFRPRNKDGTCRGLQPKWLRGITTDLNAAVALVERVIPTLLRRRGRWLR